MQCARLTALLLVAGAVCAQSPEMRAPDNSNTPTLALPDAPQPTLEAEAQAVRATSAITTSHEQPVRIKGVVSDMQGGLVPGAHVVISCSESQTTRETTADSQGFFSVVDLPAGTYSVTISSPGLQTYVVRDLHLKPGETYSLPEVSLPIARTSADVTVTLTTEQLAEEELHDELKQRVLGVLPNFYTSYQWDAAPLTARQKLKLSFRALTDPVTFASTGVTAGIQQANNTYPEFGGGPAGYWRRYGADYGDAVIGRMLGAVAFASLFHQDPRYFVMTNGSIPRRAWHAVSSTFIQRGDNRHWQLGYARLLGDASAGLIASTYHPNSNVGNLVLNDVVIELGDKAINNLVREFVLRHLAKNIPSYAKGKPPEE